MKEDNHLTSHPIPALIRQIAIPASVGYLFNTMFNAVDTYFAGLISTQALAALSLSFPVFFIIISMGTGVSTGTTALMGSALGAGDRGEARLFALQGIGFGVLTGLVLTVAGYAMSPFLFTVLGASTDYLSICLSYMNTLFAGTAFFILNYMLNAILNSMGDTRSFRNFLIVGSLLNIVFDPWLMYGGLGLPPMKIMGIALATVLIQLMGSCYLSFRVFKTGLLSGASAADVRPRAGPYKQIACQGFPASLNMMTVAIGIFVITYFISRFGKEAVAAYGIATRMEQIVLLPSIGLNVATLTLVAQNNGARLYDRIQETVHTALKYGAILMGVALCGLFASSRFMMTVFTRDPAVIEIGTGYLRIAAFVLYAYVILYVIVASLQGIKKPMFAIWIGLFRQVAAPMAIFYLFTHVLDLGLKGIWWGILVITWSAALITIFYARRVLGGHIRENALSLAPRPPTDRSDPRARS